jgi:hypothetical protein
MVIDYEAPTETILAQVMDAIEQSKEYKMKGAPDQPIAKKGD